ncbi:putative S-locus glycoprotein [Helianthus annuus]|nr:putative S-locus glycoprotein [Helianthus annuus]
MSVTEDTCLYSIGQEFSRCYRVANRETPIADTSGMLKLTRLGNLVIRSGGNPMVWSSNSTVIVMSDNMVVVQLLVLDTGNLVVWNRNKMNWQSFEYPGDTFLPGMKFGKDLVTGLKRSLTSWKSPDDPSVGRLGPWNGLGFSGFPLDKENQIYSTEFVVNEKEIYHKYALTSSVVQRIVLTWDGKTLLLHWIERIQDWIVYAESEVDNCDRFSLCGPYGICSINKHPPCSCMQGFEPRNPEEWEVSDWVSGCVRRNPLRGRLVRRNSMEFKEIGI